MAAPTLQSFPALRTAVLFSAGVLAGQSASGWAAALFLLSLSLLGILAVHTQGFLKTPPILTTFAPSLLYFTLGCLGAAVDSGRTEQLPSSTGDSPVTLTAVVLVQPVEEGDRIRFVVESSSIVVDSARIVFRAKILVTMKSTDSSSFPSYGSIVVIQGNMFRPRSARNPGEFDQRRYYMANGIHWMLSVRSGSGLQVVGQGDGWWVMREVVLPVRKYIIREIDEAIGGQEAAYLKGILLGERGELLPEVRAAFTAAGVAHILAVSGGNVAVVVVFIYLAAELIRLPRRARPLAGCLGIVFYMLLVGFQPPVVRATIMAAIMLLGTFFEERTNPVNSLGVSALLILALETRQLFDVGFQLSFLAVLSIIVLYPVLDRWFVALLADQRWFNRILLWLLRMGAVSFVAGVGTLPLTACYFGQISVIGILTNIVVVPASGLSLLIGFIAIPVSVISPWVAGIYHTLNHWFLWITLELTVKAGNLPFASASAFRFEAVDALPFYGALLLPFWWNRPTVRNRIGIAFLFALNVWIFMPEGPFPSHTKRLRVSFIDVGQGDASLIEFPDGRTILIDAGPWSGTFDSGSRVVVPFLKRMGVTRIDLLVATHPHNDHIGGIPSVLEEFEVAHVLSSGRESGSSLFRIYQLLVDKEQCRSTAATMGNIINGFPGARLYLLAPEGGVLSDNLNNSSVVFRLVYGNVSILFTGDAEVEAEQRLVSRYGDFLRASILKVGHHGSRTSSTDEFRALVAPAVAVISVGTPNRYRHPSAEILAHYSDEGTTVLRTDEEGAIVFETDGKAFERVIWNDE